MQTACRCYKLEKSFSGARTGFSAIVDLSGESWFSSTAFLRAEQGANGGAAVREPFSPKHEQVIAKKTFRQQLKELRKQWAEEAQRKAADAQDRRAVSARAAEQLQVEKRASVKLRTQQRADELAKEEDVTKLVQAAKAAQGRTWREAVGKVYSTLHADRHEALLQESRNWIRKEHLDERINEALDNPVLLFYGEDEELTVVDDNWR